ncbi:MAG: RidA family protein [Deltaproteobacteria bacterium]|nr:RidA family protein [Deltaproteobacteria bacterium]MBI3388112.1 RidA family protein [Deltaproteobacteria bacterium]
MSDFKATVSAEARLRELGIELPSIPPPAGTFVHAVRTGDLLFLTGHPPIRADGSVILGRLGQDLDADAGYEAARVAGLGMLATLRHELGSLDKVRRIVKVNGVVNATPDFLEHTKTINGASDLLVQVFGDAGQHARLAVGYSSLPWNICLEVELIAEVGD